MEPLPKISNGVNKGFFIKLNFAVQRVADCFPKNEMLGFQINKLANEVLVDLIKESDSKKLDVNKISGKIKGLVDYFKIAKAKNLADPRNFQVLSREYNKIREKLTELPIYPALVEKKPAITRKKTITPSPRQKRIVETLKENGVIKMGDLERTFPAINRRTLLRDLENLVQMGMIKRSGDGRGAYYRV